MEVDLSRCCGAAPIPEGFDGGVGVCSDCGQEADAQEEPHSG